MTSAPTASRYRSKVDAWLGALIVAVPAIALVTAVLLQLSGDTGAAVVGWLSLAGVAVLYVLVVWPVEYALEADALVVRFGVVRSRIGYRSIRGVRPTRNILASPALSMDRLGIDTGGALAPMISPADRDRFLDDLAARAPHLVRDGDRLVSREGERP